jgi:hypothetical protein
MSWKESDEAKEHSEANMIDSHKNRMPHCTGSCCYTRKIRDWEWDEEQLTQMGCSPYKVPSCKGGYLQPRWLPMLS